jgi:hypothetical protein
MFSEIINEFFYQNLIIGGGRKLWEDQFVGKTSIFQSV